MKPAGLSRRDFLRLTGGVLGAGAGVGTVVAAAGYLVEQAFAADPAGTGSLADIDHFVLLMQENRSFDHYFGSMSGVRGFDDPSPVYRQYGWSPGAGPSPDGYLLPFRLDTRSTADLDADIVNDPAHDWTTQHEVWDHGALDRWMRVHARVDGPAAPMTMGYYTRADLPVHYALADAFTVCDHYYCSVLGPTTPNRLYWMTGTLDPGGESGGPVLGPIGRRGPLSWPTFAETLQDAGVSWKIYNYPGQQDLELNGMVGHFAQFQDPSSELHRRGVAPVYPRDFEHDVRTGALPAVSWLIPSMVDSEHPAHPAASGAEEIVRVLATLVANPAVWERTALIVSYDENGGFFDHVAPPTPPDGTDDEFVTHRGVRRPIGLGFRVPCLVISPYTRGGLLSSLTYDHTSQLRLLSARFGVPVPNLSLWRRWSTSGMESIFTARPASRAPLPAFGGAAAAAQAATSGDSHLISAADRDLRPAYPVPPNAMPRQERGPRRVRLGPE